MRFLITLPFVEPGQAGFVTYSENLAAGLTAAGHDATFLYGVDARRWDPSPYDPPPGVEAVCLRRGLAQSTRSHIRDYAVCINRLRPDVLLMTYSPFVSASLPFLDWHIIRMPLIHNVGEREVRLTMVNHFWWDAAVAVSPFVARAASGLAGSDRIRVCPLGIATTHVGVRDRRPSDAAAIRIVSVGRVEAAQKRADLIVPIAKKVAEAGVEFRWTILGSGSYLTTLRKQVQAAALEASFDFVGHVGREQVLERLAHEQILVMPSDHEGLPQGLLEAMCFGVVPVVARIPGATDFAVSHQIQGLLCERGYPDDFAASIVRLARDPSLMAAMRTAGMKRVSERFETTSMAACILDVVRDVKNGGVTRVTPMQMNSRITIPRELFLDGIGRHWAKRVKAFVALLRGHRHP